jgi:hypothetical protein
VVRLIFGSVISRSFFSQRDTLRPAVVDRRGREMVYRDASLSELTLMPITIDTDTNSHAWSATLRIW